MLCIPLLLEHADSGEILHLLWGIVMTGKRYALPLKKRYLYLLRTCS